MEQSKDNKIIPMTSIDSGKLREVTPDVAYYTNQIVNLIMIGNPGGDWVLVDAGMPKSAKEIIRVAEERFGENNPPKAIILTHGHFDHVGSVVGLVEHWNVPVYAHPLESTFLTGMESYPEPDTSVEGGVLAKISSVYPHEPVNISEARQSVEKLAALNPKILVPGHGTAMSGAKLKAGIDHLLANWEEGAVPSHGRWVWTKDL